MIVYLSRVTVVHFAEHRWGKTNGICQRFYTRISLTCNLMRQDGYIWLNMINKPTDIKNKLTGKDTTQSKMFEMSSNVTIRRWYIIQHRALQSRNNSNSTEIFISYSKVWALESVRFSNLLEIIIINPPWLDRERVVKKSAPWVRVQIKATLSETGCRKRVSCSIAKTFKSKKIKIKPNTILRQNETNKDMSRNNAQMVLMSSNILLGARENYTWLFCFLECTPQESNTSNLPRGGWPKKAVL